MTDEATQLSQLTQLPSLSQANEMPEPHPGNVAHASPDAPADFTVQIATLRTAGADRFDPAGMHYIDVLARRAAAHQGSVRRMLDVKLTLAFAAFEGRFKQARSDACDTVARHAQHYPHTADELQQLVDAGDFKGVRKHIATLKTREQSALLGALVRQLELHAPQQPSQHAGARSHASPGARAELKTLRNFRNTWAKLSVDKQVAQALEKAPKNAGPINSHMLALRSLALMRDISPDYLNRFMTYADTLLSLDQGEPEKPAAAKKTKVTRAAKK